MSVSHPKIVVQVPASTSNLGSGFDTLGMALQIHSRYTFAVWDGEGLCHITASGLNSDEIPRDSTNLAYRAYRSLYELAGLDPPPVAIHIVNGIPLERGLGGSASAILAGLLASNAWVSEPVPIQQVLQLATRLDGHADNVAASLYGGLRVACRDGERVHSLPVECSDDLQIVIAIPKVRVPTAAARSVLPPSIPLQDAVFNIGRVALLVAAFATREYRHLAAGMEDRVHQTYREALVPEMREAFTAAREAGAWAAALSGSGPTIAAFCIGAAEEVAEAMRSTFARARIDATIHITTIDFRGASTKVAD
ncbi:homoserine kinase [Candidatus Poribacteria bacterium]|nr:homoserine kinase [Candidatus Poribacteria bacterium]